MSSLSSMASRISSGSSRLFGSNDSCHTSPEPHAGQFAPRAAADARQADVFAAPTRTLRSSRSHNALRSHFFSMMADAEPARTRSSTSIAVGGTDGAASPPSNYAFLPVSSTGIGSSPERASSASHSALPASLRLPKSFLPTGPPVHPYASPRSISQQVPVIEPPQRTVSAFSAYSAASDEHIPQYEASCRHCLPFCRSTFRRRTQSSSRLESRLPRNTSSSFK